MYVTCYHNTYINTQNNILIIAVNSYNKVMTNISKQGTKSKDFKESKKQLIALIAKLDKNSAHFLVSNLLTEAEQVMIIKRFAAIFMYENEYSPYRVSATLMISTSTANRLYAQYKSKEFGGLLYHMNKEETNSFLSFLDDFISAQVSPRARARLVSRASRNT